MRVGSLVFATDQGLGILAKDFYDEGIVTEVLVIRHGKRPEHNEWYPSSPRIGNLEDPRIKEFCTEMDAMLFFETPFVWSLIPFCRDIGVETFLMPMHECMPDPLPTMPDAFICPSLLDLNCYPDGHWQTYKMGLDRLRSRIKVPVNTRSVFLPVPVPRAVASRWRLRERAEIFVHNSGHGGLRGRNGTREVIDAFPLIESPIKLIIRGQGLSDLPVMRTTSGKTVITEGSVDYATLYQDGDVFLFPEKFNGLSLPLQEARASGMIVMSTDRFPMNTWLDPLPLIKPSGFKRARVSPRHLEFDEAIIDPKAIAEMIDSWYGRDIADYSLQGRTWAEENSWERLKPRYLEVLNA